MNFDLGIINANIVTESQTIAGNVYCSEGKVSAITSQSTTYSADRIIDAKGRHLMAGMIEPHVHLGPFKGFESDVETETRSALGGGITTLMNFVTTKGNLVDEIKAQRSLIAKKAFVDTALIGVVMNQTHIEELDFCANEGVIAFKHYMSKPEFEKFLG